MHDSLYIYKRLLKQLFHIKFVDNINSTIKKAEVILAKKKKKEIYMEQGEGCSRIKRLRELIARSKQTPDHPPYSEVPNFLSQSILINNDKTDKFLFCILKQ